MRKRVERTASGLVGGVVGIKVDVDVDVDEDDGDEEGKKGRERSGVMIVCCVVVVVIFDCCSEEEGAVGLGRGVSSVDFLMGVRNGDLNGRDRVADGSSLRRLDGGSAMMRGKFDVLVPAASAV